MKLLTTLLIFLFVCFNANPNEQIKIRFVYMDYIFKNSSAGKKISKNIIEKRNKLIKKSKDTETKLTKQKAIMDIDINSEGNCDITEFYGEQLVLDMDIKKYDDIKEIYKKCDEKILQDLCKEYFILSKMKIVLMGNIEEGKFNKITKELKI